MKCNFIIIASLLLGPAAYAEPQLSSWNISDSGRYARLFETTTDEVAGTWVNTWNRGAGVQDTPTYAGVHEVSYSDDWVYIRTTGLGQHIMGPWYLGEGGNLFPNYPANNASIYRIPRTPQNPSTTQNLTGLGVIGYFVDGVSMFDSRDAFSYSTTNGTDSTPRNGITGDGVWNRDAYVNESETFDAANAHQAGSRYHYHANPPALRFLLGGNVSYDEINNVYTESTESLVHSPLIGWVADGHPIYGPYGYDDATDAFSGIRRMQSGYRPRSITVRETLPAWASRTEGHTGEGNTNEYALSASVYGPDVSTQYVLGHYIEDYEYLGDFGMVHGIDFDLDEHGGRFCVTPEFPAGVYAYFTSIEADGTPRYPYNIGRAFYGDPTGSARNNIVESTTLYAEGGPEAPVTVELSFESDDVVLLYNGVEGGSYRIELMTNLTAGTDQMLISNQVGTAESSSFTHTNGLANVGYYRFNLDSVEDFDDAGFDSDIPIAGTGNTGGSDGPVAPDTGNRGTTLNLEITLDTGATPPLPPATVTPYSVTVGTISATSIVRVDNDTVTATITIPAGAATGTVDLTVAFSGPPPYVFADAFTIQ